ncbi:MAG: alpha/beta hydrolase-fold protein [Pseudomonadales bacterium]|nr:alpha/beta hydrolase-fold protein [Pseudomonadales bacterium]
MFHTAAKQNRMIPAVFALVCSLLFAVQGFAQGTLEQIKVFGPSLAGNLEGDAPERDVFVYLPPGYAQATGKRYPVVYFLHGYGVGAEVYADRVLDLPASGDRAVTAGAEEMILVMPDAYTIYGGSLYSSSPTIGDWEGFLSRDLVAYIDEHYRTLPARESRGLSGHSMGGYGTLRVGMKHPEVFGALYAMSSCCLLNQAPDQEAVAAQIARMAQGPVAGARGFANALQAQAAAWAPNPQNPPHYFDWPYKNDEAQPQIAGKWAANSPLMFTDQYVPSLKAYKAIMLDVGDKDTLAAVNTQLDATLTRLGVAHGFEIYDGEHGNRVGQRFVDKLLPFFSEHLKTAE